MRLSILTFVPFLIVVSLSLTTFAAGPSFQWLPGADVLIPVYTTVDEKGGPGAADAVLAYDRDTRQASKLRIAEQCFTTWGISPTPGHGAIAHIFQVGVRDFAVLHESGRLRVDHEPDHLFCHPLPSTP